MYTEVSLGECVARMRFSKERIFPDNKVNSKVTITVRFSLLVDLCDVSVTHVNTV